MNLLHLDKFEEVYTLCQYDIEDDQDLNCRLVVVDLHTYKHHLYFDKFEDEYILPLYCIEKD